MQLGVGDGLKKEINKNTKTIGSVIKAIEIVKEIAESETGLGVTEISSSLDYGVSATYHLVNTLKLSNIIEQDRKTKKYKIGFELFRICGLAKNQSVLANTAQPYLDKLREKVDETCNLAILDGNNIMYIAQSESTKLLKMFTQLGAKVPFYCTGAGKALLAYQPLDIQHLIISGTNLVSYTENTITTPEGLTGEFDSIKEKGYALDNEEREYGVTCVAVPIFDCYGEAVAAISVSGPTARLKKKEIIKLIGSVRVAANELSHNLGYVEK